MRRDLSLMTFRQQPFAQGDVRLHVATGADGQTCHPERHRRLEINERHSGIVKQDRGGIGGWS